MKRGAILFGLCLLILVSACQPAPRGKDKQEPMRLPAPPIGAGRKAERVCENKPTLEPTATPEPKLDAPWFTQRNEQLRMLMHQYTPDKTEEQIERDISRMDIDPDKPMVALTFDDGPRPGVTDQILDVLEQYNARATFFVLGWRLNREANQQIVRRAAALGCEIGNHTWAHRKLVGQNYVSVRYEIENTNDAVFNTIGVKPRCFRPPGGTYTYESIAVTREDDMVIVLWSQSGNVHESDPKKIAQNVEKQIVDGDELQDGDIILLHDTPMCMVDAVKIIVPELQARGFQLVTVWELLNCSNKPLVAGDIYDRR